MARDPSSPSGALPEIASPSGGLPLAPSLDPGFAPVAAPAGESRLVDGRVALIAGVAVLVAIAAAMIAQLLGRLIAVVTNVAFFGRLSTTTSSPAANTLGLWVIAVPVVGGLIVGLMARFGSQAIRGHGIPEAMEQVLTNESRIPARITFLKPLSAAVAIGTGGPFGAEGPIIATGGALGSLVGQLLRTTSAERKTLLAAGAAAGMTATFGSPVSAVLLAVELLLFEYRPRSLIPVALASAAASATRLLWSGGDPAFAMPAIGQPSGAAIFAYIAIGAIVGLAAIAVTRGVYAIEDAFARLPVHWMWWPAIGAIAVGAIGYAAPHTLGVGYDNIEHLVGGSLSGRAMLILCGLKLASWAIALGSGTSGGTLAPLLTIGGGVGAGLGALAAAFAPALGVDPRVAALVGMASLFAGASRALLASVVFAFETTRQPLGLLPLLGGCTASYLISCLFMQHSIMTEKIARRGVRVLSEYATDYLEQLHVRDTGVRPVVTLAASDRVATVRAFLLSGSPEGLHHGFPILDGDRLAGVLTRRELLAAPPDSQIKDLVKRSPVVIFDDSSLREAANRMARFDVGRLPVVTRAAPDRVVGFLTRNDLFAALRRRVHEAERSERHLDLRRIVTRGGA